ncbi:hypothetical protein [Psychromonas sp. MME2]|uniref:hypothetical protein n=1 Tax=unclassified Psychromonas TaxID=2614957 RepID=UPI00339BB66B
MKTKINLYQPSCYPKREKATFKQFSLVAALCVLSLVITPFIVNQGIEHVQKKLRVHESVLTDKQNELSALVVELQKNRAPEHKVRRQLALQQEINAKQQLLASLDIIDIDVMSFSVLMKGLSLASTDAVSIDNFSIINGRLNISGYAKQSDSVPLWLSKVQTTDELLDIAFEQINISESDNGFNFILSNMVKKEDNKRGQK